MDCICAQWTAPRHGWGRQSQSTVSLQDIQFQLEQALGFDCATANLQYVTHYIDCPISGSLLLPIPLRVATANALLPFLAQQTHIAAISLSQSPSLFLIFFLARPKSIQIRQKLPPKDLLLQSSQQSGQPSQRPSHLESSSGDGGSNSHDEDGHLVRNRTLHSIELLDYYLNAKQALMKQPFRLRSGFQTDFICRSSGSRPPARILWSISYAHAALPKDLTQLRLAVFD